MEAEENGANNELLYLSAWSIMRKAYKAGNIEYSVLGVPTIVVILVIFMCKKVIKRLYEA